MDENITKYCRYCNQQKLIQEMCKKHRKCKKCHALAEKIRRDSWDEETRKKQNKTNHQLTKDKKRQLAFSNNQEEKIKIWVKGILKRAQKSRQFESRGNINKDFLIKKCFEALLKFPEINFCFIEGEDFLRANMASLDRINPNLPYSDDNIQVIPLWINSGKLDLTEEQFYDKLINFSLNNEYICNRLRSYFSGTESM